MTTQLATTERQLSPASADPSIGSLLQAVVDGGITESSVTALEKLCELKLKMRAIDAEQEFNTALVSLQSKCQGVQANRIVPGNQTGSVRYKYASYEEISRTVRPLMAEHGFAATFNSRIEGDRVIVSCTLRHTSGHSSTNEVAIRGSGKPPGSSEAQGDGSNISYGKRYALCNALDIVIETEGDARQEGACISSNKADDLRERLYTAGGDERAFLDIARVNSFEEIPEAALPILEEMIAKKERAKERAARNS